MFCVIFFWVYFLDNCKCHSLWGLADFVSFPAMSDPVVVFDFSNFIWYKKRECFILWKVRGPFFLAKVRMLGPWPPGPLHKNRYWSWIWGRYFYRHCNFKLFKKALLVRKWAFPSKIRNFIFFCKKIAYSLGTPSLYHCAFNNIAGMTFHFQTCIQAGRRLQFNFEWSFTNIYCLYSCLPD